MHGVIVKEVVQGLGIICALAFIVAIFTPGPTPGELATNTKNF
jgi:hypothetical protein